MKPFFVLFLIISSITPASAAARNFFAPQWQGERLGACLADGSGCGKPAADAFCKAEGYDTALTFQREPLSRTRLIDSDASCHGSACMAFVQIKCFTARNDLASLQQLGE